MLEVEALSLRVFSPLGCVSIVLGLRCVLLVCLIYQDSIHTH